jgi:uncharacterized membrane protein
MTETLVEFFLDIFSGMTGSELGKCVSVFIVSMLPIIELRGGMIAAALLNLSLVKGFIICFLGNILPVPFILWFIRKILEWMRNVKCFKKIVKWLDKKVENKKGQIEKFGFWGLVAFVGIPLPGTGAWTGTLIAAMLDMDKKKSFLAALVGVLVAGVIMAVFSYGVLDLIF